MRISQAKYSPGPIQHMAHGPGLLYTYRESFGIQGSEILDFSRKLIEIYSFGNKITLPTPHIKRAKQWCLSLFIGCITELIPGIAPNKVSSSIFHGANDVMMTGANAVRESG